MISSTFRRATTGRAGDRPVRLRGPRRVASLRLSLALGAALLLALAGAGSAFAAGPTLRIPGAEYTQYFYNGGQTVLAGSNWEMKCGKASGTGIMYNNENFSSITLTECEDTRLRAKCQNTSTPGEVQLNQLSGPLVFTYPSKQTGEGRETGIVLAPPAEKPVAEFKCSIVPHTLSGSLIAVVSPLRTLAKNLSLSIKRSGVGQTPSEYETAAGGVVSTGLTCKEGGNPGSACGLEQATPALSLTSAVNIEGATALPVFEPYKADGFPFTSTVGSTEPAVLHMHTAVEQNITCAKQSGSAQMTNVKHGKITIKYTECTDPYYKLSCTNNGHSGEIEAKELNESLAYVYPLKMTGEGRQSAMVLSPASGETLLEFQCSILKFVVTGSIVAPVRALNVREGIFVLNLAQSEFTQTPSEYETESGSVVKTSLTCKENSQAAVKCGDEQATELSSWPVEATIEA